MSLYRSVKLLILLASPFTNRTPYTMSWRLLSAVGVTSDQFMVDPIRYTPGGISDDASKLLKRSGILFAVTETEVPDTGRSISPTMLNGPTKPPPVVSSTVMMLLLTTFIQGRP